MKLAAFFILSTKSISKKLLKFSESLIKNKG